ncbi:MAG: hypothetical protein M3Z36_06120 [Acidobacteriota bacterium]|nr:hypothetical protein [Acidobacteriota bacterium]
MKSLPGSKFPPLPILVVAAFLGSSAQAAPAVVSISPGSGSGASQLFTATYSESNGVGDLNWIYLLFGAQISAAGSCLVVYQPASNTLYLYNDSATGVAGSIQPGTNGTVSNSQCSIANAGAAGGSATTLSLPLTVTFPQTFGGVKNIYGYASNNEGMATGWQTLGAWTPWPSQRPSIDYVNPTFGGGSPQTFTATFSEPSGVGDLSAVYWLFHSQLSASGGCLMAYIPPSNTLYLFNDGGTGLLPGSLNPGTPGSLSNSQCTVASAGPPVVSAIGLQLSVAISFAQTFGGKKTDYLYVSNNEGLISGWQNEGSWITWPPQAPTIVSMAPINGGGSPVTFTATFADSSGVGELNTLYWIFNSQISVTASCSIVYFPGSNTLYLYDNSGAPGTYGGMAGGSINPGTPGTLSNPQCTVSDAGPAIVSATTLQLPLTVTFAPSFTGSKNVYANVTNNDGMRSGWQTLGTWIPN